MSRKHRLFVWFDVDANDEDRVYWKAFRKTLNIGANSITKYVEIDNAFELIQTEEKLQAEGWEKREYADEDSIPAYQNRVLTLWEKTIEDS